MDHLIVITGSMGTGKTTTLGEASDLLSELNISHAAIDLDALGLAYFPNSSADLVLGNLQAVAANYAAAGIQRLIIAAAVESRANLDRIRDATGAGAVVVCRLRAAQPVMEARVAARERGIHSRRYVARVRVLEELLDAARLEDFSITTDDALVTDTARELLTRAGWIAGMPSSG